MRQEFEYARTHATRKFSGHIRRADIGFTHAPTVEIGRYQRTAQSVSLRDKWCRKQDEREERVRYTDRRRAVAPG